MLYRRTTILSLAMAGLLGVFSVKEASALQFGLADNDDEPEEIERDYKGNQWGGMGSFNAGWMPFDPDHLNEIITQDFGDIPIGDLEFPEMGPSLRKLGGGGGAYIKDIYLGGKGSSFASFGVEEDVEVSLLGGYGQFQAGYSLWHNPYLSLTPLVGYGVGGYTIEFESDAPPFGGIRTEETDAVHYLDLSAKLDFFPMNMDSYSKTGFYLGLMAGYLYNLNDTEYRTYNLPEPLNESLPAMDISGFYVKISIGGGGIITDRRESIF